MIDSTVGGDGVRDFKFLEENLDKTTVPDLKPSAKTMVPDPTDDAAYAAEVGPQLGACQRLDLLRLLLRLLRLCSESRAAPAARSGGSGCEAPGGSTARCTTTLEVHGRVMWSAAARI